MEIYNTYLHIIYIYGKIKVMFQTTNQLWYFAMMSARSAPSIHGCFAFVGYDIDRDRPMESQIMVMPGP